MNGIKNQTYLIREDIQEFEIERFIAVGGESIVFKGVKKSIGRTYALKFREKTKYDRNDLYDTFLDSELDVLRRLEQCSASRIAGIIPNVPRDLFKRLYQEIPEKARKSREIKVSTDYFCIIEDYIPGCDLLQYCKGDERRGISSHTPSPDAPIDVVLEFQRKLLNWTIQFCDIMTTISANKKVLHLDIKPENIMVVRETEALMVIDFGKAIYMKDGAVVSMDSVFQDYFTYSQIYGTEEYAAPECVNRMQEQLTSPVQMGIVDVRSDIFSFGATLWECINPDRNFRFEETMNGYFRRDLFNAPIGYAQELEDLIIKCTECNPDDRFQSYAELRAAAKNALKKTTTREHNRNRKLFSIWAGIAMVISILSFVFFQHCASLSFEIAQNQFRTFVETDYSNFTMSDFETYALAYIDEDPSNVATFREVLNAVETRDDAVIGTAEADVLKACLNKTDDKTIKQSFVDSMIQNAESTNSLWTIAGLIDSIDNDISCEGKEWVDAIVGYSKNSVESYATLKKYYEDPQDRETYRIAIMLLTGKIKGSSDVCAKIAESENSTKEAIKEEMKQMEEELSKNAG